MALGGIEGLEYRFRIANAGAVVGYPNADQTVLPGAHYPEQAILGRIASHRVTRVEHEIQKHLLKATRIGE